MYHSNMNSNNFRNNFPGYPLSGREGGMDINHIAHLQRKDIPTTSPLTSPVLGRARTMQTMETPLQQDIIRLKQQHEVQQQILLQQFQAQQQQLAAQHEHQINEHVKQRFLIEKQQELAYQQKQIQQMFLLQKQQELLQQKQLEEQQRREHQKLEQRQLDQIKNKKSDEQSAIASSAVKQKLQQFVLNKKQREEAVTTIGHSPPHFRHWQQAIHSSLEQQSPPHCGMSPPYKPSMMPQYMDDFPLRKTASEPNLKVRSVLKQKVMEKRNSPLLIRKDRVRLQKRATAPLTIDTTLCSSPESGPNSPPTQQALTSNGSLSSLQNQNETMPAPLDLSLYASPSMPNISLGRPRGTSQRQAQTMSPPSEAELRARGTARLGLPLTGHALPGMVFYPSLPVIDSEVTPPTSPAYVAAQMRVLEQARSMGQLSMGNPMMSPYASSQPSVGFTPEQVAQARLHRHRPLNRTQSAPLPLPNPLLQQHLLQQKHQQEQILKDKMFVKQHIRNTVLQRAGSKNHMENVDEETEAKLAQEMREGREDDADVVVVSDDDLSLKNISEPNLELPSGGTAFLMQQREMMKARGPSSGHLIRGPHGRPLSRTQSSPLVTFSPMKVHSPETSPVKLNFTTGLSYDSLMLKHQCTCGNNSNHPEHAGRLQSIWARLQETGLTTRCEKVKARKASVEEIKTVHGESYSLLYGTSSLNRQKLDPKIFEGAKFCMLPCGGVGVDSDTVWNDLHTSHAARMATGCVIELAYKVATGELKNGMAVVRPPGHHAEAEQAMGFCYFNSVAVTAKLLNEKLKLKKILILDWDVHHGNGTQQMFYDNPNILYMSIHRHDNGNFFPGTGAPEECGGEEGEGFNVNIAFAGNLDPPMADAEYLTAFRSIVMPIAQEFNPDIILVSSGFDAANGHPAPLGGYLVTPACFGHMTKQLMTLAGGKVVLSLEGGYDLPSICDSSEVCVQALLNEEIPAISAEELKRPPNEACVETLQNAIKLHSRYWSSLEKYAPTVGHSHNQALNRDQIEVETVTAMASLSMTKKRNLTSMSSSESEPMEES